MLGVCRPECIISIHALFAEGDHDRTGQQRRVPPISIHALFAEGDSEVLHVLLCRIQFLSTPSSQRATVVPIPPIKRSAAFLSTPSSQRATLGGVQMALPVYNFYPRPLRRGRRVASSPRMSADTLFLSTPSSQRATPRRGDRNGLQQISIHALFAEGDHRDRPHGGDRPISIHALFAEGDDLHLGRDGRRFEFLSTPSSQRATQSAVWPSSRKRFLSTPSSQRATVRSSPICTRPIFLSTPSSQRATGALRRAAPLRRDFYPRPLRRGRRNNNKYGAWFGIFLSTPSSQRATMIRKI